MIVDFLQYLLAFLVYHREKTEVFYEHRNRNRNGENRRRHQ